MYLSPTSIPLLPPLRCSFQKGQDTPLLCGFHHINVTGSGKTLRMGFFVKITIAIHIIRTNLVQVLDRSRVLFQRYAAFCVMTRELFNSRNYGLKALLCSRMRSPYTTSARTLAVGGAWRSIVDLTKRASVWRQKRQAYYPRRRLSADCSKITPVSQFSRRTRRLQVDILISTP